MTTNYTHIINDNLDMMDIDIPVEMDKAREYSNGMGWNETEDGIEWEDDYPTAEDFAYLHSLEQRMADIVTRCGVYGAEEWGELASYYSDIHKDIFGYRPHGIGLFYHGIRA